MYRLCPSHEDGATKWLKINVMSVSMSGITNMYWLVDLLVLNEADVEGDDDDDESG